ncbi:hypothetical protein F4808DRAFT_420973 [Astrocystis sublimbata]|nr:hypothetical protein F4808DRAFT_420973 [Astrocystis sublimbata]
MANQKTTVLITGANRGIGRGLLEAYLARPNHDVIAAVRNPGKPSSLDNLPTADGTRLVVVKIDAEVESDAKDAVNKLSSDHGIDHLDLVIANAGLNFVYPSVAEVKIDDMMKCMKPNLFGTVWLYQATRQLLNSASHPKWITMGSTAGSIGAQDGSPNAAYGPTKAAAHWITNRINMEEKKLNSFAIHPGWVATDMGNYGASLLGMKEAPVSIKDSCKGIMVIADMATKESHGGTFWNYTGEKYPW